MTFLLEKPQIFFDMVRAKVKAIKVCNGLEESGPWRYMVLNWRVLTKTLAEISNKAPISDSKLSAISWYG